MQQRCSIPRRRLDPTMQKEHSQDLAPPVSHPYWILIPGMPKQQQKRIRRRKREGTTTTLGMLVQLLLLLVVLVGVPFSVVPTATASSSHQPLSSSVACHKDCRRTIPTTTTTRWTFLRGGGTTTLEEDKQEPQQQPQEQPPPNDSLSNTTTTTTSTTESNQEPHQTASSNQQEKTESESETISNNNNPPHSSPDVKLVWIPTQEDPPSAGRRHGRNRGRSRRPPQDPLLLNQSPVVGPLSTVCHVLEAWMIQRNNDTYPGNQETMVVPESDSFVASSSLCDICFKTVDGLDKIVVSWAANGTTTTTLTSRTVSGGETEPTSTVQENEPERDTDRHRPVEEEEEEEEDTDVLVRLEEEEDKEKDPVTEKEEKEKEEEKEEPLVSSSSPDATTTVESRNTANDPDQTVQEEDEEDDDEEDQFVEPSMEQDDDEKEKDDKDEDQDDPEPENDKDENDKDDDDLGVPMSMDWDSHDWTLQEMREWTQQLRSRGKEWHDAGDYRRAVQCFGQAAHGIHALQQQQQQSESQSPQSSSSLWMETMEELCTCRLHQALCALKLGDTSDLEAALQACHQVLEVVAISPTLKARALYRRAKARLALATVTTSGRTTTTTTTEQLQAARNDARQAAFLGDRKAVELYGQLLRGEDATATGGGSEATPQPFASLSSSSSASPLLSRMGDGFLSSSSSSSNPAAAKDLFSALLGSNDDNGGGGSSVADMPMPNLMGGLFPNGMASSLLGAALGGNSPFGLPSSSNSNSQTKGNTLLGGAGRQWLQTLSSPSTQNMICAALHSTSTHQIQHYASLAGVPLSDRTASRIVRTCHGIQPQHLQSYLTTGQRVWYGVRLLRKVGTLLTRYRTLLVCFLLLVWIKSLFQ